MNFVNMQKKTRQEQQLERLIRLRSDSELAIFDEVQVARDEVEEAKQEVEKLREYVDNHLIGPQGEQGIKGDKGDRGEKGDKGDKGKDGRDGRDGRDGMDGIDGQDGENGKDGKDGSPDTAEQIVSKLQTVRSQWLDAKAIKNLPQPVINNYQSFIGRGGGASVGLETIKSSGTIVKQGASTLEFDSTFSVTPTVNGAIISAIGDGTGDVHGPASSTDEAIARFDGTTGKLIQDYTSGAPTISDTGAVTIPLTTGNSLVVDTNTLVVDATNNRVGIGNTAPATALEVTGDITLTKEAARTISIGASTSANTAGGALTIASGAANGTSVAGGALTINSGAGGTVSGASGAITIQPGTVTVGNGGAISILGRAGVSSNNTGSTITITAGNSVGAGQGGSIPITAGNAGSTSGATGGTGGAWSGIAGNAGSSSQATGTGGVGGSLTLSSGTGGTASGATSATGGKGGNITITAKNGGTISGTGTAIGGAGGDIAITAGNGATATTGSSNTAGAGGSLTFTSGNAGASGGNVASGNITFQTGTPVGTGTVGAHIFNVNGATEVARINGTGLGLFTNAPTHSLTLSSTSTGIALYNTADQTTNYERGVLSYVANVLTLNSSKGGSGTVRNIALTTTNRTLTIQDGGTSNGSLRFANGTSTTADAVAQALTSSFTVASGVNTYLSISGTITGSGTNGYNGLLINITEASTGSGVKRLISAQVGSVDKFVVDNAGNTTATTFNPATKQTYNITNVTTDRAYDANATTLDEVADTLGTLIADLRAIGLVS